MTAGQDNLRNAAQLPIGNSGPWPIGRLDANDLAAWDWSERRGPLHRWLLGYKGFLFDTADHTLYNLNDLLSAGSPFTELNVANDINNSGQFVGVGLVGGVEHGFVGQTVPEPSSVLLLFIAAVCFLTFRFKQFHLLFSRDAPFRIPRKSVTP